MISKNETYEKQTLLLLQVLREISDDSIALKGGTAINFFYRNAPRLSVDIDLTFLPILPREDSYKAINNYLKKCKNKLEKSNYRIQVNRNLNSLTENKFVVSNKSASVKIEPNYIVRGTVFETEHRELAPSIVEKFGINFDFSCVSFPDIYGGKICAALERQHPRDLFDVKILLENEGITTEIKNAFLFYLLSSRKPYIESLDSHEQDISSNFFEQFSGMTSKEMVIDELSVIFGRLKKTVKENFERDDLNFLKSTLDLQPNWNLVAINDLENFPSIKWRMLNIKKMTARKRRIEIENLEKWFE